MGATPDELIFINKRLLELLQKATEDKIAAEESIEIYIKVFVMPLLLQ